MKPSRGMGEILPSPHPGLKHWAPRNVSTGVDNQEIALIGAGLHAAESP
jgi:hypothetical protein